MNELKKGLTQEKIGRGNTGLQAMNTHLFDDTETAFAYKTTLQLKKAYFLFRIIHHRLLVKIGPSITRFALRLRIPIDRLIKSTLFAQFCGGETLDESMTVVRVLGQYKIGSVLDYSVEGEEKEDVFENTLAEILKTIKKGGSCADVPFAVFKVSGLGHHEIFTTPYPGQMEFPNHTEQLRMRVSLIRIKERVHELCKTAYQCNLPVMIDAEESWLQPFIDSVAETMMEKYNTEKAIVFNTYQMYRTDRLQALDQTIRNAIDGGYFMGVKLVRGAYLEKERERAAHFGYPSPVHTSKENTDRDYDRALARCIESIRQVSLVSGTHNENSCYELMRLMEEAGLAASDPRIYFSQLLGMSDHLSFNLAKKGYNVAKYVPYGPIKSVLPYLFRRAEENTAITGQMSRELSLVTAELRRRKASR